MRNIPWLCRGGMTNIMGLFLLISVTGLRPSLLVVKFLANAQVTLPSPNVFLSVIGQFMRWLRNKKEPVPITCLVVVRTAPGRALSIYRTPCGTLPRELSTRRTLLWNTVFPIRVRHRFSRQVVATRVMNVPADVMVILGLVRAQSMVLDLCGTEVFRAP